MKKSIITFMAGMATGLVTMAAGAAITTKIIEKSMHDDAKNQANEFNDMVTRVKEILRGTKFEEMTDKYIETIQNESDRLVDNQVLIDNIIEILDMAKDTDEILMLLEKYITGLDIIHDITKTIDACIEEVVNTVSEDDTVEVTE